VFRVSGHAEIPFTVVGGQITDEFLTFAASALS
jgi:hypothetical protein